MIAWSTSSPATKDYLTLIGIARPFGENEHGREAFLYF
jgi:hypothetical protein